MFQFKIEDIKQYLYKKSRSQQQEEKYINNYKIIKEIGKGHYGKVFKAIKDNKILALKEINVKKEEFIKNEKECLTILKDNNIKCNYIVKFYNHFKLDIDYFVFELCNGVELFEYVTMYERLNEYQSKKIIKMLLTSISFLHDLKIVHRDIKPENIIVEYNNNNLDIVKNIKIIDFGLAKYFKDDLNTRMKTKLGTPYYMSPEILNRDYNYLCDSWAAGVIFYILLAGYAPFNAQSDYEILQKIKANKLVFYKTEWKKYNNTPIIGIIKGLLKPEEKRLSPEECLKNSWFLL